MSANRSWSSSSVSPVATRTPDSSTSRAVRPEGTSWSPAPQREMSRLDPGASPSASRSAFGTTTLPAEIDRGPHWEKATVGLPFPARIAFQVPRSKHRSARLSHSRSSRFSRTQIRLRAYPTYWPCRLRRSQGQTSTAALVQRRPESGRLLTCSDRSERRPKRLPRGRLTGDGRRGVGSHLCSDLLSTWDEPLHVRHVEGLATCGAAC